MKMIEQIPFKTRARTIDHLGREQIADCPTAISELWKNAYDAYARHVELNIFDGPIPVAALVDDGHGMSKVEIVNKWLVVGTDSKATLEQASESDRNGLPQRPRQGQKGIGRLSCANLGSLLLLLSKRKESSFAAALIDWRIFENPFLLLQDIEIPVVEFDQRDELFTHLNQMYDSLMGNLWGTGEAEKRERDARIAAAWSAFDDLETHKGKPSTKARIENTIIGASFESRHLQCWDVWTARAAHGTAMFIADISDDLLAQLTLESAQHQLDPDRRAQERLFQTLSNFADPFSTEFEANAHDSFRTTVVAWNGLLRRPVLDEDRSFKIENLQELEHIVEGRVDDDGVFHGRVKAFGKWLENEIQVKPAETYRARIDTLCGPFHIRIGTYERDANKSTHTKEQHSFLAAQAELYSGFMVHRDGLRVMPYGREDNDYFEIEKRRTLNAGRYFWSNRNLFGRVLITRDGNPNLKDKAGREGLIDNRASKRFRALVENILIETAKRYFGSDSDNRNTVLPDIIAQRAAERAMLDSKKVNALQRKRFRSNLKQKSPLLDSFLAAVHELSNKLTGPGELQVGEVRDLKARVATYLDQAKDFSLSPVPSYLGSLKDMYDEYRQKERRVQALLAETNSSINIALERLAPRSADEVVSHQFQSYAAQLHARIRKWAADGRKLLSGELERFNSIVDQRNKSFHSAAAPLVEAVASGTRDLGWGLKALDEAYQTHYRENNEIFSPYLSLLENLREDIDFENVLTHAAKESANLRKEVDRLHALAQLGITVEIIGHEIEALDLTLVQGMRALPEAVKDTDAYRSMSIAQTSLSDRWRFLSPLKLSGEKMRSNITGNDISSYLRSFLGEGLERDQIIFECTTEFLRFSVFEQPSRIYPVFINLVNNARYWVTQSDEQPRKILLDFAHERVIVADTGPGVSEEDLEHLFTLFFTKKSRGGRGIGLYLCRANLLAGGHSIAYETDPSKKCLSGANFAISFKGESNV